MPNAPAQPGKLPASLVLEGAVHLAGQLSSLLDGRLQLDAVQTLDTRDTKATANLQSGAMATLSIPDTGLAQVPLEAATVKVSRLRDGCITLEFAPADSELAARYRDVIAAGFTPGDGAVSTPRVTTATTASNIASSSLVTAITPATEQRTSHGPGVSIVAATAEYTKLLAILEKQSLQELQDALTPFFADLAVYILDISSRIKLHNSAVNPHYDAAIILQRRSASMAQRLLQQVANYFRDLMPQSQDDSLWQYTLGSSDELNLIDPQDFEDFLAIDRTVSLGEDLHKLALEALTVRLAILLDADPNRVRLPIHVRQLCRAFQQSLKEEGIPKSVLSLIFDYFAKCFVRQLTDYYGPLNTLLSEHGVLPHIEKEIQNKGSLLSRNRLARRPEAKKRAAKPSETQPEVQHTGIAPLTSALNELNQFHRQIGDQLGGALGNISPATLYRSVIDALNFKREAEGLADGNVLARGVAMSGTWDGATVASTELDQSRVADAQAIARALSALQRNSQAREDVQQSESLRAYLASNKENISVLQNSSGLTADSLNQLDMVDNLFGTIKSQLDVSADLKPSLGNLQIPLAKLALLDPRFFVDHRHTARNVVDKLSRLASSANFPNKALESRINSIVDDIICDYENDDSVFDTALDKIEKLLTQQERALARNIDRVVRTQEGQQKLAEARREVSKIIRTRVLPPAAPRCYRILSIAAGVTSLC